MPSFEAIVDSVIPRDVPKPIPTRTINTKGPQRPTTIAGQSGNQPIIDRNSPAAESATPEESVRLSPQLSALARKEQAHRQRELALKQREKDLEEKLAKAEKFESLTTKLGSKDFSEAESLGLNYEEYTNYLLTKQADEDPESQKFKALEAKIEALEKGKEESAKQEYEETVAEYRTEIKSLVTSNPDFSSVKEMGREDAVLQLILDSWEEDGEEMTVDQACKDIEDYLVDQANKFSNLTKIKSARESEERKLPPPKAGMRTLTNQMQPQGETPKPQKSLQHLSESERYAEARRRVLARRQQQG